MLYVILKIVIFNTKEVLKKMINDKEFLHIIKDLTENCKVQELKNYRQHYNTSRFAHCLQVSYISYLICKKLKLDYKAAARSGMLHDLFLYDWRKKSNERQPYHGFSHPRTALENSLEVTNLSIKEQDIIVKHMWPLTVILPKYKESYIVCFVDKYCTLAETFRYYKTKNKVRLLSKAIQ